MGEIRRGMIISNDDLNDKSNATVISAREMAMVPPRFFMMKAITRVSITAKPT